MNRMDKSLDGNTYESECWTIERQWLSVILYQNEVISDCSDMSDEQFFPLCSLWIACNVVPVK